MAKSAITPKTLASFPQVKSNASALDEIQAGCYRWGGAVRRPRRQNNGRNCHVHRAMSTSRTNRCHADRKAPPSPSKGGLAFVLHAHLPFVRQVDHPRFLEESWLFEAIAEVYIPLLTLCEGWRRDHIPARLTLSVSPTLCSMLTDPLLMERAGTYIETRLELAEKEVHRTAWIPGLNEVARYYFEYFSVAHDAFKGLQREFLETLASFENAGILELITTGATHPVLPLLSRGTGSAEGQIRTALQHHRSWFGKSPKGFWLPECGYSPWLDAALRGEGIEWIILDSHAIGQTRRGLSSPVQQPVFTPNGLAIFVRDLHSSAQVWSRECGYPGDLNYRDFYRDIGFDLDADYLEPYLPCPGHRGFTGLKYHKITGMGLEKQPYDPVAAKAMVAAHASHFIACRSMHLRLLERPNQTAPPPLILAPFDAELFGHWWHEGPSFLDCVMRQVSHSAAPFDLMTPSQFLSLSPPATSSQQTTPSASSWGEGGYWDVWLNKKNAWLFPQLRQAETRFATLLSKHPTPDLHTADVLRQAARELLLSQSSDWPFMIRPDSENRYARDRFLGHIGQFHACADWIESNRMSKAPMTQSQPFPQINLDNWRLPSVKFAAPRHSVANNPAGTSSPT